MTWKNLVPEGQLKDLPEQATLMTDNGISAVYNGRDGYIYKRSIPYLIENEISFMDKMNDTAFVPMFSRHDRYTIRLEKLEPLIIFDKNMFMQSCQMFLFELHARQIRHGDLTKPHIFAKHDRIVVIDWAESRWATDPAPDKRPEGDEYWLNKTMEELIND